MPGVPVTACACRRVGATRNRENDVPSSPADAGPGQTRSRFADEHLVALPLRGVEQTVAVGVDPSAHPHRLTCGIGHRHGERVPGRGHGGVREVDTVVGVGVVVATVLIGGHAGAEPQQRRDLRRGGAVAGRGVAVVEGDVEEVVAVAVGAVPVEHDLDLVVVDPVDVGHAGVARRIGFDDQVRAVGRFREHVGPVGERGRRGERRAVRDAVVVARGHVYVLTRGGEDNLYRVARKAEFGQQENNRMASWIEFRGKTIYLMLGNGQFFHLDADKMEVVWSAVIDSRIAVRDMSVSPDGQYAAVTFRNGRLWIYDATIRGEFSNLGLGNRATSWRRRLTNRGDCGPAIDFWRPAAWDLQSSREVDRKCRK